MIARQKRKTTLFSWRLRLQTSGIYRFTAIPGRHKTGGAGFAQPRPGLAPESALRLHPCRALSSAPVSMSLAQDHAFAKLVVVVDREE
jgi:hypothetical protein